MRRRRTGRFTAVLIGAVMLAVMVPVSPMAAYADATPFAVTEARLVPADGEEGDRFGGDVAISGDTMVVGAQCADGLGGEADVGAAYVYVREAGGWTLQQRLQLDSPATNDLFGYSVAIDGDRIVVGAPNRYTAHGPTGAAYVFTRTGGVWSSADQLPCELEQAYDRTGAAVDIYGDTIVIGCPERGDGRGAVRPIVWTGSYWDSGGGITLTDPDGQPDDRLGGSVSISGDRILASEGGDDIGAIVNAGSVLAFERSGDAFSWAFTQKWSAPVPVAEEMFGGPIDLSDSGYTAIVGSPQYDNGDGFDAGAAYIYVYELGTWTHRATLANPGPNSPDGDWFGSSVALDGDAYALVGAFWDDSHTGSAYYFTWEAGSWGMRQKVDMTDLDPGGALLGYGVAVDEGTSVVGALFGVKDETEPPVMSGCAYVFNSRGVITGVVRDGITGDPIEGIEMSAYIADAFGEPNLAPGVSLVNTDADGRYTFSLNTGQVYVGWMDPAVVYPYGYWPGTSSWPSALPVSVTAGETTTLDIDLYLSKGATKAYSHSANRFHSAVQRLRFMQGK